MRRNLVARSDVAKKIKKLIRRRKQAQFPFLYSRSSEPPATMYIPSSSVGRGGAAKLRTVSLLYASPQSYRVLCGILMETLYVGYTLETKSLQYFLTGSFLFAPSAVCIVHCTRATFRLLEQLVRLQTSSGLLPFQLRII